MINRSTLLVALFSIILIYSVSAQSDSVVIELPTYPKEVLKGGVNSEFIEARPLISGNGDVLYFVRRYAPDNFRGVKDFQDVYVSYYDSTTNTWSEGKSLGKKVNNKRRNAIASVTDNGEEGVFFNMYKRTGDMPLVRMRKSGDNWTDPRPVFIENFSNVNPYADYFVDFDNSIMLLAIEADSTFGQQDIYISFPNGQGGWKEPVNIGDKINTKNYEFAPFLASDGRSLFFSSYGHDGYGGADIYMSVRLDETWLNWTTPVNLGPSINSALEETYFSIDDAMEYLYYTTYTPRQTDRNIVRVALPEDFTAINGPVLVQLDSSNIRQVMASGNYTISTDGYRTNTQGLAFEGWPQDEEVIDSADSTETAIASADSVTDNAVGTVAQIEEGASGSDRYAGFIAAENALLSPEAQELYNYLKDKMPGLDFMVKETAGSIQFKIVQNLEYEFNSVYVSSNSLGRLRTMAEVMKEKPALRIELLGHTDNVGSEEANERVAERRVKNIAYYMQRRGIGAERIEEKGLADAEPLNDGSTDDDQRRNRRVETVIHLDK